MALEDYIKCGSCDAWLLAEQRIYLPDRATPYCGNCLKQRLDAPKLGVYAKEAAANLAGLGATLSERGKRYGDFSDNARIAQDLKNIMQGDAASRWSILSADKREALEVIAQKISRILTGDAEYKDNWHDIQGYAKLVEDRCK